MRRKWQVQESGEILHWDTATVNRLACCDCGLVHTVVVWKERGGVAVMIERDNRTTGQFRRHRTFAREA